MHLLACGRRALFHVATLALLAFGPLAGAETLRVVTYNVQADTFGASGSIGGPTAGPGLTTVLQAIGAEHLAGNAQPIDVLALQELYYQPATTLSYITNQLNSVYGAGTYAYSTAADPTDSLTATGNGPSGLIYNTHTVELLSASAIGTPSSASYPRDPMRYELQPLGAPSSADFYLYVSHAKSGTGTTNADRRNDEANLLRSDAATLGPNAHVIYAGDFNINGSSESTYQTMIAAGVGAANDPANPAHNWTDTTAFRGLMTETATKLQFRDDIQFVTSPMLNQPALQLVSGSYTVFGNNCTTPVNSPTNTASNTALADLSNRTDVLTALTTATDHLPVVADYQVVGVPEPTSALLALLSLFVLAPCASRRARSSRHNL